MSKTYSFDQFGDTLRCGLVAIPRRSPSRKFVAINGGVEPKAVRKSSKGSGHLKLVKAEGAAIGDALDPIQQIRN